MVGPAAPTGGNDLQRPTASRRPPAVGTAHIRRFAAPARILWPLPTRQTNAFGAVRVEPPIRRLARAAKIQQSGPAWRPTFAATARDPVQLVSSVCG
jgi:hypothetical protein